MQSERQPRLFSYVVATDRGFAPNPFHGVCTLACCKPKIRFHAEVDDYVIGLSPRHTGNRVVYAMRVSEKLTLDKYWRDPRFRAKKPKRATGGECAVGDNIYHWNRYGWVQDPSAVHGESDIAADTSGVYVLVGKEFTYWGDDGPLETLGLPMIGRAHRSVSNRPWLPAFEEWFAQQERGRLCNPTMALPLPEEGRARRRKPC